MARQRNGEKIKRTKEVYSLIFVSIHCPSFFVTLSKSSYYNRSSYINFVIFVIVFAFGITVSWLELTPLRSDFKCLSSSQEQSSSSLDNNLNSLTPGTIEQKWKRLQHALGYVEIVEILVWIFHFLWDSFRQICQKSSHLEQQMKNLDSRETVLPRRWGIETWIFGIQRVDWVGLITTVKRLQSSLLQR